MGQILIATINGQAPLDLKTEPGKVPWPLDTKQMGVSLEEFERTYLPQSPNG